MILKNTQNIQNMSDMTPYSHVVMNFIEANNLPSYSYPEAYELFVVQLDLPIEEFEGELFFKFPDNFLQYFELIDEINALNKVNGLYFQRKNAGIADAEREVRAMETLVAKAEIELVQAQDRLVNILNDLEKVVV